MRIAIVTTSYPRRDDDAAGHFVRSEARALATQDDVHVICPDGDLVRDDAVTLWPCAGGRAFGSPGVMARLRAAPWRAIDVARFAWHARATLASLRADRVIAQWLLPCGFPIAADRDHVEVVVHGSDARLYARLPRAMQNRIATQLISRDAQLRVSAHALLPLLGDLAARCVVTPPPIEVPEDLAAVDEPQPYAVVVSRLVRDKRVSIAVAAAATAGMPLLVIGDGPERSRLVRQGARVLGAMPRREALRYIRSAAVLLHPAEHDGAPTVVREARALGTRVVSFGAGDAERWAAADSGITLVSSVEAMSAALLPAR